MKNLLVTIATGNLLETCRPFLDNQQEYATTQGLDYRVCSDLHWTDLHASFSKVWELHQALEDGRPYIIWADLDVAFTNMKFDFFQLLQPDYFMAAYQQMNWKSWAYLCNGFIVLKNTPQAKAYVAEWVKRVETKFMKDHPWEQWYFDEIIRETNWANVRCCTGAEIGCFSKEIWHDGTIWKKGMPSVHFAGPSTWARRVETFLAHYKPQILR